MEKLADWVTTAINFFIQMSDKYDTWVLILMAMISVLIGTALIKLAINII